MSRETMALLCILIGVVAMIGIRGLSGRTASIPVTLIGLVGHE
jgi:hypothetical protein